MTSSVVMISLIALAHRHVQFVDFALARRMLKLPHPLFADDVNLDAHWLPAGTEQNKPSRPTQKIVIAISKGITDQSVSSFVEPSIGRGISDGLRRR